MTEIVRTSGLRVTCSAEYEVADGEPRAARGKRRGASRKRPKGRIRLESAEPPGVSASDVIAGLADQLELVDAVPLVPTTEATLPSGIRRGPRSAVPAKTPMSFELDVAPDESAVLLIEQDGIYSWVIGETRPASTKGMKRTRRGAVRPREARRTIRFEVEVHATSSKARRTSKRGFVTDLILRPVKALVFKFAAKLVMGQLVKRLERDVQRGFVRVDDHQPDRWTALSTLADLRLPKNCAVRILLLVHGTFSSTRGAFGALGLSPEGRDFLDAAHANYDAVLGFDHATLSEDPLENAEQLAEALRTLADGRPVHCDFVTHSRGALVVRSLLEHVLPNSDWAPQVRHVVFVAGPNGGTQLAHQDNWKTLIDLYTNIAIAGTRAVTMLAPATPAAAVAVVLRELLSGLARFVKALATATVDESQVPGIAAMNPEGRFVVELNRTQPGQPAPRAIDFYVVTSDFESHVKSGPHEFPGKLKRALADHLVNQLMSRSNDLVVDVESMTHIDPHVGGFVRDTLDFGTNGHVYHTNYFLQGPTLTALRRWLRIENEALLSHEAGESGVARDLPSVVDRDFVQVDAGMRVEDVREVLHSSDNRYVVMRRYDRGRKELFHYGFRHDELDGLLAGMPSHDAVEELGVLHETQSSGEQSPAEVAGFSDREAGEPWSRRTVVRDASGTLGVVPHASEVTREAAASGAPRGEAERPAPARRRKLSAVRGGIKSSARPESPAGARATTSRVDQYFRAEMDGEIVKGREVNVMVEVSADELAPALGRTRAGGVAKVDPFRRIAVTVVPRTNFRVVGDAQVEIEPTTAGNPETLLFTLKATTIGGGEVWVVARQGPRALVTLKLYPTVVARATGGAVARKVGDAVASLDQHVEKRHQLSIYELSDGHAVRYMFDFRSRNLDATVCATSGDIKRREKYLASLYENIEENWEASGADAEEFTQKLRAFGAQLYRELVPSQLQKVLWKHRDQIDSIEVISTEPLVPWEMLHLTAPDAVRLPREERFLGSMGMVRWLHGAGSPPTQLVMRREKVVAVVPVYPEGSGYELEETEEEFRFLKKRFGATRAQAQPKNFRSLISRPGSFDVLHFAGHGFAEPADIANAELVLEGSVVDGEWSPNYFSSTEVEGYCYLQKGGDTRPIVVLNACQAGRGGYKLAGIGGFSQAFLKGRAGVFVSSMWSVGDEPARTFTEALYGDLDHGKRLADAVKTARKAARHAGDATWLAYVVYGDPFARVVRR